MFLASDPSGELILKTILIKPSTLHAQRLNFLSQDLATIFTIYSLPVKPFDRN